MNLEQISFFERMTAGDLKVLAVLLESLRTKIDTANLTELDLLNHALQEALDLSMYLKALIKLKEQTNDRNTSK